MELKHLKTSISYKIDPNPAGGFIARSADPAVPPIEAPTMEEVQAKVQSQLMETITGQFPGLKMPVALAQTAAAWGKTTSHTVTVTNSNGESVINKNPSPEEMRQFAQQFAGVLQKDFPELARELSVKAEKSGPSGTAPQDGVILQTAQPAASFSNISRDGFTNDATNRPILPEATSPWKFVAIFAMALALVMAYLLYAHR